jgi:hypothetical protein
MKTSAKRRRGWIALPAIFALLLYSVVAGFADAAMAQPQHLDAFGNPICSAHADQDPSSLPGEPSDHSHTPDCCLAGCNLAGGHALPPAAQPFLLVRPTEAFYAAAPDYRTGAERFEWSPLNPRAPPASA